MATPVSQYTSQGQPSDSVGNPGDLCFDFSNRINWIKQPSNTWVGGAYSTVGSVGPAQLSYNGVPPSNFGQNGNGCCDVSTGLTYLKSGGAWSQVGNIVGPAGQTGAQGYTSLTTQAMGAGAPLLINGTTASSTAQPIVAPGTSATQYFVPQQASAFLGFNAANSGVALTLNLVDTTNNNAVVYSGSAGSNAQVNVGPFAATAYPLIAGHVYAWTYTGSGTANTVLNPFYLTPAAATSGCISVFGQFTSPPNTAFSSTVFNAVAAGVTSTSSVNTRTFQLLRAGALTGLTTCYSPASAGAASASVSWVVKNYTASTTLASGTSTNTGQPVSTTFSSPIAIAANQTIFIALSGSGTGYWTSDLNVIV